MNNKVKYITKVGILSSIALALMFLEISLPIFPSFLKIDLSNIPSLIGGFSMGPVAGTLIVFIKNILHFIIKNDGTAGAGNIADIIVSMSFIIPAALMYKHKKTFKTALLGMIVGIVCAVTASIFTNLYISIPVFSKIMPIETIIAVMNSANKHIIDLRTYVLWAVIPFNLLKYTVICLVSLPLYKRVSGVLHL